MIWTGFSGNCLWVYHYLEVTDEDWNIYCQNVKKHTGSESAGLIVCVDTIGPSSDQLAKFAVEFATLEASIPWLGTGIAANWKETRERLSTPTSIFVTPFPIRVFDSIEKTLFWLDRIADIDPEIVKTAMLARIPTEYWKDF